MQFSYATWFFPVESHLFKLLLKLDKDSVKHLLPEVIRVDLHNDYRKGLT